MGSKYLMDREYMKELYRLRIIGDVADVWKRWEEYEREKIKLQKMDLHSREYEERVKNIAEALGL